MAHPRVVHCKRARYDVYIGRPSKWGNPYKVGRDGTREQVIERYEHWLRAQPQLVADLHALTGKTLGCWCAPRACHGEILARLADEHERDSENVDDGDPLCACAHRRSSHATPASSDTRCTGRRGSPRPPGGVRRRSRRRARLLRVPALPTSLKRSQPGLAARVTGPESARRAAHLSLDRQSYDEHPSPPTITPFLS